MKNAISFNWVSAIASLFLVSLVACNEDDTGLSAVDATNLQNEAATDAYFEDADDLSTLAVWADDATTGGRVDETARRISNIGDLRFSCAEVTITPDEASTPENPSGMITIDFGTGCTDVRGDERKGKIIITYAGRRFSSGSTRTVAFEDYYINDVKLEGLRNVTNLSGTTDDRPVFQIEVVGGKVTWPDGTTATREVRRIREWIRAANPQQDQWIVSQPEDASFAAAGTSREGRSYQVNITEPLVYKRECAIASRSMIAVEGVKELIVDGKQMVVDYGDGSCDKTVTITVDGEIRTVELKGK